MSLWKWKEIQEMLRCYSLAVSVLFLSTVRAQGVGTGDQALWQEYGLISQRAENVGKQTVTTYRMKDLTGALAAWEWLRSPAARLCDLSTFCTEDGKRITVQDGNYILTFDGPRPVKAQVNSLLSALPNKRDSSLPAVLTFIPSKGKVANSGRYILGPVSMQTFAGPLNGVNPGFEQGAEAQVAQYKLDARPPINLAVFYYPTPEMARLHTVNFKGTVGANVKRSGVLVAMVYGPASQTEAETLLSRVQYEARITWNEVPPPSPIKPLYRLLKDILYISGLLSVLSLSAGLVYAGMRIYRRRYGTLDSQEAMTTLHLSGD